jgi:hypothetical protein
MLKDRSFWDRTRLDQTYTTSSSSSSIRRGFANYGLDLEIKLGMNWLGSMTMLNHWSIMSVIISLGLVYLLKFFIKIYF